MQTRPTPALDCSLLARLQREWLAITSRPAVVARAHGWCLGMPFGCLDEVVVAAGYCPSRADRLAAAVSPAAAHGADAASPGTPPVGSSPSGDDVLARLLVAARTDDVAARVVLQRLLPGLLGRARRWGRGCSGGSVEAFDELVSAAWTIIREFPVERRPGNLAAKLLRDAEHRAFGKAHRRLLVHELTEPRLLDVAVDDGPALEPRDELAAVVAAARSLTPRDRQLLGLLAAGRTAAEAAVVLEVSERTVRNHRAAVVHRLRAAVLAA